MSAPTEKLSTLPSSAAAEADNGLWPAVAIGFPGQGVHEPEKMARLLRERPTASGIVQEAEDLLDEPLAHLLTKPSQPEHTSRESQLRAYLGSAALWLVAEEAGLVPEGRRIIFGASAGETVAMWVAGFYDFESGLKIAQRRGEEMHKASIINPGEMLVATGLPFEQGIELAEQIPGLYAVNDNPGVQTVFSGSRVAIAAASEKLNRSKVKLHWPDIKEAAHSIHMQPAVSGLKKAISRAQWSKPKYDFMGNQARMLQSVRSAKKHFAEQLTRGVLLTNSANELYDTHNARIFVDVGQGKVLYGQMKRQFRHLHGENSIRLISVVDELLPDNR